MPDHIQDKPRPGMQALYYHQEFGSTDWRKLLRSRWQLLLTVLLVHLLLIILWPSITRHKNEARAPLAFVVRMLEAPEQHKPEKFVPATKPLLPPSQLPVSNKPRTPAGPATPSIPITSNADTGITTVPAANAEAGTPTLTGESLVVIQRDISKVIKQVEREMPNRILTDIKPEKSSMVQFGINVAAAARPRGTSYQNITMSDGTAMTKVTTSAGSYCVVGAKPGADITRTPGIQTVSCGSY